MNPSCAMAMSPRKRKRSKQTLQAPRHVEKVDINEVETDSRVRLSTSISPKTASTRLGSVGTMATAEKTHVWVTVGKTEHQAWLLEEIADKLTVLIQWDTTGTKERVPVFAIRQSMPRQRARRKVKLFNHEELEEREKALMVVNRRGASSRMDFSRKNGASSSYNIFKNNDSQFYKASKPTPKKAGLKAAPQSGKVKNGKSFVSRQKKNEVHCSIVDEKDPIGSDCSAMPASDTDDNDSTFGRLKGQKKQHVKSKAKKRYKLSYSEGDTSHGDKDENGTSVAALGSRKKLCLKTIKEKDHNSNGKNRPKKPSNAKEQSNVFEGKKVTKKKAKRKTGKSGSGRIFMLTARAYQRMTKYLEDEAVRLVVSAQRGDERMW